MKTRTSASLTKRFNVKHAQMDLFWPIGSKFLTNAVTQIYDKKLTLPLEAKISGKLETFRTQSFLNYEYSVELPLVLSFKENIIRNSYGGRYFLLRG